MKMRATWQHMQIQMIHRYWNKKFLIAKQKTSRHIHRYSVITLHNFLVFYNQYFFLSNNMNIIHFYKLFFTTKLNHHPHKLSHCHSGMSQIYFDHYQQYVLDCCPPKSEWHPQSHPWSLDVNY